MNLLADESVDGLIVERLRQDGNDVLYVAEFDSGITDTEVLRSANQARALLMTADKDFGEPVFRRKLLSTRGVVLLRLAGLSSQRKAEVISKAFHDRGHQFATAFTVISPGRIRVRRKKPRNNFPELVCLAPIRQLKRQRRVAHEDAAARFGQRAVGH